MNEPTRAAVSAGVSFIVLALVSGDALMGLDDDLGVAPLPPDPFDDDRASCVNCDPEGDIDQGGGLVCVRRPDGRYCLQRKPPRKPWLRDWLGRNVWDPLTRTTPGGERPPLPPECEDDAIGMDWGGFRTSKCEQWKRENWK